MINKAYLAFIEQLEKYYPSLSTALKIRLPEKLFEVSYKKGARILNYKQVQDSFLFIYKGSAMELLVDKNTLEEVASNFWFEKDFPYTTPGLFGQEPLPSYVKLLEDAHLVGIIYTDFMAMKIEFPEIEPLIENIRSHYAWLRLEMENDFRYPAIHRVRRLELEHQNIYNIAEMQHIAQYHRVSMETLRRLRSR